MERKEFMVLLEKCLAGSATPDEQEQMMTAAETSLEYASLLEENAALDTAMSVRQLDTELFVEQVAKRIDRDDRSRKLADKLQLELRKLSGKIQQEADDQKRIEAEEREAQIEAEAVAKAKAAASSSRLKSKTIRVRKSRMMELTAKRSNLRSRLKRYVAIPLSAAALLMGFLAINHFRNINREITVDILTYKGNSMIGENGEFTHVANRNQVCPGQSIHTGGDSFVKLRYDDGTTISLASGTKITLADTSFSGRNKLIHLDTGAFVASVRPQQPAAPLIVVTPHAQIKVVGTKFRLEASSGSRLKVIEGTVEMWNLLDNRRVTVNANQEAVVDVNSPARLVMNAVLSAAPRAHFSQEKSDAILVVSRQRNAVANNAKRIGKLLSHLRSTGMQIVTTHYGHEIPYNLNEYRLVVLLGGRETSIRETNQVFLKSISGSATPVICMNPAFFPVLGMANETGYRGRRIVFSDKSHPLAASFSKSLEISTTTDLLWSKPAPGAHVIAVVDNNPEKAAIYAFEKGADLLDTKAPARRVAFPASPLSRTLFTNDGWVLFGAAVDWCLEEGK